MAGFLNKLNKKKLFLWKWNQRTFTELITIIGA